MIKFADIETTDTVRQMWKTVFDDTDRYIDLHFEQKYKPDNTLIYFDSGEAVASLQMLPYSITFYRRTIPFYYLAGLCTLPDSRNKGYMSQLISQAHDVMQERNIPLAILVPAQEWLCAYYEKYGYETVFEKGEELIPLKQIVDRSADLHEAYTTFDRMQQCDFCVQKSFDDFVTIVRESEMDSFPDKTNLAAMARIVNPRELLSLYAEAASYSNIGSRFVIEINKTKYRISDGKCTLTEDGVPDCVADERTLCRLLFGYKTGELGSPYRELFPEHRPIINLMLE